ncbi:MAG: [LysW]-aminoadipate kinase [Chloroflexi bacterium]|nr:[LysW]-aminoadipate kinase [Chloroflexota bacterium]
MSSKDLLVVKLGGGEGLDMAAACSDLAEIAAERSLVVVHGVSAAMNQLCGERGIEVQSLTSPSGHSSRYTPPAVRDVYVCAAQQVNDGIVAALDVRGVCARGLSGEDVVLWGERKRAIRALVKGRVRMVRDDCSGTIRRVDAASLEEAIKVEHVPILPPMAKSDEGLLNVDGDRAAAAVAGALGAGALVILSNVRGLYRDFPDEGSFVKKVKLTHIDDALDWAQGRMKRKVLAAQEALTQDVERVIIADGRAPNAISQALAGAGTWFAR